MAEDGEHICDSVRWLVREMVLDSVWDRTSEVPRRLEALNRARGQMQQHDVTGEATAQLHQTQHEEQQQAPGMAAHVEAEETEETVPGEKEPAEDEK